MLKLIKSKKIQLFLIILLTFIAYSNIFQNEFVGDDVQWIVNWDIPKSLSNIPNIFTHNYGGNYRPMRTIFLMIDYQLFGLNPLGYHFVSLIPILLNPILVYFIVEKITKKRTIAFISSLLFGVHPIHTEPLTMILVNVETIGVTFYLGSFLLYLISRDKLPKYNVIYFLSILLGLEALFHHESTIVLLLMIIFYDLCFKKISIKKINFKSVLKIYGPYFAITLFYIFIRVMLLHIVGKGEYLEGSFYLTMLTMTKAFVKYIELLILPINLSINPIINPGIQTILNPYSVSLNRDKILAQSIFDFRILLNLVVLISLLIVAIKSFKDHRLVSFAIGWFFIALMPYSNIIPVGNIMQERYAYLASFGFCLLIAYLFNYLYFQKFQEPLNHIITVTLMIVMVATLSFYTYRTHSRNRDWKDNITMWSKLSEQLPEDVPTNLELASLYGDKNQDDQALRIYQTILDKNANVAEAYLNIGKIYQKHSQFDEAIQNYSQSLALSPDSSTARELLSSLVKNKKEGPLLVVVKDGNKWIEYLIPDKLLFMYPEDWNVTNITGEVGIKDSTSNFIIQLEIESGTNLSFDSQKLKSGSYGKLLQEGLAEIPNVDRAYVRVWDDPSSPAGGSEGVKKLQFFLFKDSEQSSSLSKVIKILVYPGDSPLMKTFDNIARSIVVL